MPSKIPLLRTQAEIDLLSKIPSKEASIVHVQLQRTNIIGKTMGAGFYFVYTWSSSGKLMTKTARKVIIKKWPVSRSFQTVMRSDMKLSTTAGTHPTMLVIKK